MTSNEDPDETESSENLQKAKEKLEAETGKKYRVKEKLPSVQELILQEALRKKTFVETITFPAIVLVLFLVSLHLFLKYLPPIEKKYTLPQMQQRHAGTQGVNRPQIVQVDHQPIVPEPVASVRNMVDGTLSATGAAKNSEAFQAEKKRTSDESEL